MFEYLSSPNLDALTNLLTPRAFEIMGHDELRLSRLAVAFGTKVRLSSEDIDLLVFGCRTHDIGKLARPELYLSRTPLSKEERLEVEDHPSVGAAFARINGHEELDSLIRFHHFKWNGDGYPRKENQIIKGSRIPFLVRMLSIIDTFDAMTNTRQYHNVITPEEAREEIIKLSGTYFDPELAGIFCRISL